VTQFSDVTFRLNKTYPKQMINPKVASRKSSKKVSKNLGSFGRFSHCLFWMQFEHL